MTNRVSQPDREQPAPNEASRHGEAFLTPSRPGYRELCFEERSGLLVDREANHRADRRLQRRLKTAQLRSQACVEDLHPAPANGKYSGIVRPASSG